MEDRVNTCPVIECLNNNENALNYDIDDIDITKYDIESSTCEKIFFMILSVVFAVISSISIYNTFGHNEPPVIFMFMAILPYICCPFIYKWLDKTNVSRRIESRDYIIATQKKHKDRIISIVYETINKTKEKDA